MMHASYNEKKERLSAEIRRAALQEHAGLSLRKTSSNLFRKRQESKQGYRIDKRDFNRVISIDPVGLVAEVEGMATYDHIVAETLKYACLPTVVPELKTITIGGAISGCGIESSSFRYGLVHEKVLEFDLLLAEGSVITCTPDNQYRDIFFAIPNTYGTFGYILRVKFTLVRTKKHVMLKHKHFADLTQYFNTMERLCTENMKNGVAFIEGVIFHPEESYITTASFVDAAPYHSNYKYMHIYYRSLQSRTEDYLTTADYIWRWDTDWFWCSNVFHMQNPLMRLLFGKLMLHSSVYTKMMHTASRNRLLRHCSKWLRGNHKETIIQDVLIPVEKAMDFFRFFQQEIGMSPIWTCPYHAASSTSFDFCPLDPQKLYLDFGFWGNALSLQKPGHLNRKIEYKVQELAGFKSLYSDCYYTEPEFWTIYNHARYEELKHKYDPKNLLSNLYLKCVH